MPQDQVSLSKLILVIIVLLAFGYLRVSADLALSDQLLVLQGCWPEQVQSNNQFQSTVIFWNDQINRLNPNQPDRFFYQQIVNQDIWFFILPILAVLGWCGSVFYRAFVPPISAERAQFTYVRMLASFLLSILGGVILCFLFLFSEQLVDAEDFCIGRGSRYLIQAAAILSGLFIVPFYAWLEKIAGSIWNKSTSQNGG
jgi:hypothetical protein